MKCGEPYSPQHRCPRQVPLHVLEEVLDSIQTNQQEDLLTAEGNQSSDEELLTLSVCVAAGIQDKRTIRMQGTINNHDILILVDSGSLGTFISERIVKPAKLTSIECAPIQVTVANGSKLSCISAVNNLSWWTQGHISLLKPECYHYHAMISS